LQISFLIISWLQHTIMLNDFSARLRSTSVEDATAVRHGVLVWIFHGAVVVKRVDDTQVQQHSIQYLHTRVTHHIEKEA